MSEPALPVNVAGLIAHARGCVAERPEPALDARIDAMAAVFDDAVDAAFGGLCAGAPGAGEADRGQGPGATATTFFVYHVPVPAHASAVRLRDVRIDHGAFDYGSIVAHAVGSMLASEQGVRVVLATDAAFARDWSHPRLAIARLEVDAAVPMFERAVAMAAFVRSRGSAGRLALLDGDAFPVGPLAPVFEHRFDVAVTYRHDPGLMPLNEGVILADGDAAGALRGFFDAYVATYARLVDDPVVRGWYGDVRRWRGGQLALNAIAAPAGLVSTIDAFHAYGAGIAYYPCTTFNHPVECAAGTDGAPVLDEAALDAALVLHLKGGRKAMLDAVRAHQARRGLRPEPVRPVETPDAGRASRAEAGVAAPGAASAPGVIADRAWSLDTTLPTDHVPDTPLDWPACSLTRIADHFKTDKGSLKHRYTESYERVLAPLRARPGLRLLEIGVACGASLRTWARWFHDARVVGIDIRPACSALCADEPSIEIRIADACRVRTEGEFDVIVDDGSHVSADIVDAFRLHWPALRPGGVYVIEDLKCTHNPAYPDLLPFPVPRERFDRAHFMALVDALLVDMDWRRGDVESIEFRRELAILRKRG